MQLSIVVAASLNNVIGKNNTLPWHLPSDLKFFKQLTTGHTMLMGRKTYDSIGKPLPLRESVVVTRDTAFKPDGVVVFHNMEEALEYCREKGEVFVIGGETIFEQVLPVTSTIYYTRVHTTIEDGNAFFTLPTGDEWRLVRSEFHEKDEKNPYDHTFEVYERRA